MPLYKNPATGEQYRTDKELNGDQLEELFNVDVPPTSARMPAEDPVGKWLTGVTGGRPPEITPASQAFSNKANMVAGRVVGIAARVGIPIAGAATGGILGGAIGGLVGGGLDNLINQQTPTPGGMIADTAIGAAGMLPVKAATMPGAVLKGMAVGGGSVTIDSVIRDQELPTAGRAALGLIIGGVTSGMAHGLEFRSALNEVMPRDQADIVAKVLAKQKISEDEFQGSQSAKEAVGEIRSLQQSPILNQFGKPFDVEHTALPSPDPIVEPPSRITNAKPNPATNAAQPITPPKFFFDKVQTQTDIPVYDEVYKPIHDAATEANHQTAEVGRDLKHVFKGLTGSSSAPRRQAITAWMQADAAARPALETTMRRDDLGRGLQLETMMRDRFAKAGLSWDKFFKEYMPQIRGAGSVEDAFLVEVPKEVKYFKSSLDSEFIGPSDTDSLGITARLSKQIIHQETLQPAIQNARDNYLNKGLDSSVEAPIREYIDNVQGHRDQMHKDLSRFWNYVRQTPILNKLTRSETRDHIDTLLGLQYGGTMAGRLGPLVRNALQTPVTGFMYLGKWYPTGIKNALSKEGYQFAVANGALGAEEGLGSEMSGLMGTQSRLGKATSQGFKPYKAVDEYNRSIMFHGGYTKATDAARRAKGDINKFVDLADLDVGFGQAEAVNISSKFAAGDIHGAAKDYGIALADNTQFMYSAGDRIPITTGSTPRRMVGAFGNWPLWYGNLLKQAITGPGSWGKKGIVMARWAAASGAVAGIVGGLAKSVGVEHPWGSALGYTFLGPAAFIGGPILEGAQKTIDAAQGVVTGRKSMKSAVVDVAKASKPFIPYYYAGQDLYRFAKTTNDRSFGEAVLNATGLVPYRPTR